MLFSNTTIRFIDVLDYKPFFMRCLPVFLFFGFLYINCNSQNDNKTGAKDSIQDQPMPIQYSSFVINEIEDIKPGTNERSPEFIKNRLELLIGDSYRKKCDTIGVVYPPQYVLFRAFKHEKEFEIWVGNDRKDTLQLLATLPICAIDHNPGPKLKLGDGKTPEGFYTCQIFYGSSNGFMWIKLNTKEIENYGTVNYGSSFKLCLEYPLSIDINRTTTFSGGNSPGNAICIHGNCVTAGCISFKNEDFLPIFLSARFHNSAIYGYTKIHIFPFRFTDELKQTYSNTMISDMKKEDLLSFWANIQKAYDLFNNDHKALKVSYSSNKYFFSEY
jgi:murein L,D-transpeptidase YafK